MCNNRMTLIKQKLLRVNSKHIFDSLLIIKTCNKVSKVGNGEYLMMLLKWWHTCYVISYDNSFYLVFNILNLRCLKIKFVFERITLFNLKHWIKHLLQRLRSSVATRFVIQQHYYKTCIAKGFRFIHKIVAIQLQPLL